MHLAQPKSTPDTTPEATFAAKYAWLMRWALHFAQNDRAAAEDLVQETFVRMLLSWEKLHTLDDLEPLLYSYLRFAYLTERRKGRSHAFQSLSTVDSDTVVISLQRSTSFDQIEVQNELRSILAFLLWRRPSAKFASIFVLRFFHGFFPEEIASICLATRHSVDLSLMRARVELKAYLLDPHHVHVPGWKQMSDIRNPNVALPVHDFVDELKRDIFSSPREECPSPAQLDRQYRSITARSLDCALLAHIVACEPCLDKVTSLCGAPPPSARSMEDSLGSVSRTRESKNASLSEKVKIARTITRGKRRMREIFEHRPSGLAIALNGEISAVRDVSSPHAVLKVEIRSIENLDLIEIFSEQGMLLLVMPLLASPPMHSPELREELSLSAGRTLSLLVSFTFDGASIEAVYQDPHFTSEARADEPTLIQMPGRSFAESDQGGPARGAIAEMPQVPLPPSWWRRLLSWTSAWLPRTWPLAFISATIILIGVLTWVQSNQMRNRTRFGDSLENSARAENNVQKMHVPGVIHQRVQVQAVGKHVQRDIYRDLEGRRTAKKPAMNKDEQFLSAQLEQAGVDWSSPLSAAGFKRWHEHLLHPRDEVIKESANLLVLKSTVDDGHVRSESLTVRLDNLHPVARTILLEDHSTIEIAELSYDIVPWNATSSDWFEPLARDTRPPATRGNTEKLLPIPSPLSESQVDLAVLSAQVELQEMNADTERLQVIRTANGAEVKGVVESESRKLEIVTRLKTISHVQPGIFTYRELDEKPEIPARNEAVKMLSVISADSQLDHYCTVARIPHDQCQVLSYRLLTSSTTLARESKRLSELQQQYPPGRLLTSEAKLVLAKLVAGSVDHLAAAIWEQERTLRELGLEIKSADAAALPGSATLDIAAQDNLALVHELVYSADERSRPASTIFHELAGSVAEAREELSRISASSGEGTAMSSGTPTPH